MIWVFLWSIWALTVSFFVYVYHEEYILHHIKLYKSSILNYIQQRQRLKIIKVKVKK